MFKTLQEAGTAGKSGKGFTLEDVERNHFLSVLDKTGWRVRGKNGVAEILGMKITTLTAG
jgi:formate hydrogenlyase transcriptional activator